MKRDKPNLRGILASGRPAVVAECVPPTSADGAAVRRAAAALRGKVDAVGVTDNREQIRMSALATAAILREEGLEPILHMTTRDRNRIALLSDVLGAQALGLTSVLCTSGDHHALGKDKAARGVFDLDTVQLLAALDSLRRTGALFGNGRSVGPCSLCLGAVAHPRADPPEMQAIRLAKKVRAGADFLVTQPVFEIEAFAGWLESLRPFELPGHAPILAGILVPPSAERAREMNETVPGVRIPEAFLERLAASGDARQTAIDAAVERIGRLREVDAVKGFYLMTENDAAAVVEIVERSGL